MEPPKPLFDTFLGNTPSPSPTAGLKPMADGMRRMPPFGSPKREGRQEQTKRSTGGVASSQVDPPQGGTGARVQRHWRWRGRCAALAPVPRPAALREVRLNGFPGALAEVCRPGIGGVRRRLAGRRRRVSDTSAPGLSDAAIAGKPAYSLGPHSVSPLRRLAGGRAPSDPRNGNGAP